MLVLLSVCFTRQHADRTKHVSELIVKEQIHHVCDSIIYFFVLVLSKSPLIFISNDDHNHNIGFVIVKNDIRIILDDQNDVLACCDICWPVIQ